MGKRAKGGRAALGRRCGCEESAEEAPFSGDTAAGGGARPLSGRGEGPGLERTLLVRKPRGHQPGKKPRGALRGSVGEEPSAPTRARHVGSAPAARGRASRQRLRQRQRQRQEQKQKGGTSGTVTPEPNCAAPEPREPVKGTRLPGRHVGRGQLPASPAPAPGGRGPKGRLAPPTRETADARRRSDCFSFPGPSAETAR